MAHFQPPEWTRRAEPYSTSRNEAVPPSKSLAKENPLYREILEKGKSRIKGNPVYIIMIILIIVISIIIIMIMIVLLISIAPERRRQEISTYLSQVVAGKLPMNQERRSPFQRHINGVVSKSKQI